MAKKSNSRPARWGEALGEARTALEEAQQAASNLESAFESLRDIQAEYQDWLDGLAEVSRGTAMEEKLQAIADLSLEPDCEIDLSDAESALDEAEAADLPLGFGRD